MSKNSVGLAGHTPVLIQSPPSSNPSLPLSQPSCSAGRTVSQSAPAKRQIPKKHKHLFLAGLTSKALQIVSDPLLDKLTNAVNAHGKLQFDASSKQISNNGSMQSFHFYINDCSHFIVHSLKPMQHSTKPEDFICSMWELVDKENTEVYALANPIGCPVYMPPQNANAWLPSQLAVNDSKQLPNGMRIDVKKITVMEDLTQAVTNPSKNGREQSSTLARTVQLEIIKGGATKTALVHQMFSCWSDARALSPEIAEIIVNKITHNAQVHCEAGKNRSPSLAVMCLLKSKKEKLNQENLITEIASAVVKVRQYCHDSRAMDATALRTVLNYALHITNLSEQMVISASDATPKHKALNTSSS